MSNQYFKFKQFTINQDKTAMKVGTDGVLLGAWADISNAKNILDIGCGTGLLSLMCAQRNSLAQIDSVEIEPHAAQQANQNFLNSPWSDRINLFNTSILNFLPNKKYDAIICNPPYFTVNSKNCEQKRVMARHCETLTHLDLIRIVADRLLSNNGKFHIILPTNELKNFIELSYLKKINPVNITYVKHTTKHPPKRSLITLSFTDSSIIKNELILKNSDQKLTNNHIKLVRNFYLFL